MERKIFSAADIAKIVEGRLLGDPNLKISGLASLKDASAEDLSFLSNKKYSPQLSSSKSLLVIVGHDLVGKFPGKTLIVCEKPNLAISKIISLFAPPAIKFPIGIHPAALVSKSAKVGTDVHIGANAIIEDEVIIGDGTVIGAGTYVGHFSKIGEKSLIYPNVSIRERCVLGNRVIVHCGAVIGSDGFGFEAGPSGIVKIEQVGIVEIGDDVEIGANCTIDRARFGKTILKRGVKLDNLVQVAHNVIIGEFSMLIGQSGVAGSTEIGKGAIVAAQAGVSGHLHIGDGAKIAGQSGVAKDIAPGHSVLGTPAEEAKEFVERLGLPKKFRNLSLLVSDLEKKISELEKEIVSLKDK